MSEKNEKQKHEHPEDKPTLVEQAGCCGGHCKNEATIETGEATDLQEELMEEEFFLMYHLHLQPSEILSLPPFKRKWLISRFIHQKQCEREIMEEMKRSNVGRVSPEFLKKIQESKLG